MILLRNFLKRLCYCHPVSKDDFPSFHWEELLSVLAVKGYCFALNNFFALKGMELSSCRELSIPMKSS